VVGHLGQTIKDYFADGSGYGVKIEYIFEEMPLGTGGALYYFKDIDDDILLVFGDLIFDIDISKLYSFYSSKNSSITLVVHPNSHPFDSDIVKVNSDNKVVEFDSKKNDRSNYDYPNLVNSGIYMIKGETLKNFFAVYNNPFKMDFDKDFVFNQRDVYGYKTSEYIKDVGTPERLASTEDDLQKGIVSQKNLNHSQRCIFIDRDGTINRYTGLLTDKKNLILEDTAAEAIRRINKSVYLSIVITNQPVIARGMISENELMDIHNHMEKLLGAEGAYVDDLYYCPHHPDKGYEGEVSELKIVCDCRKPSPGMIYRAAREHNINLKDSWIIGDTTSDIMTGKNARIRTILVKTGEAGKDNKYDVTPEYIADNLLDAVNFILEAQ